MFVSMWVYVCALGKQYFSKYVVDKRWWLGDDDCDDDDCDDDDDVDFICLQFTLYQMENERDRVSPSNKWNVICIFIFSGSAKACRMDAQNLLLVCMLYAYMRSCVLACLLFFLDMQTRTIIQMQHIEKQWWWRRIWRRRRQRRISIIIIIISHVERKVNSFQKTFLTVQPTNENDKVLAGFIIHRCRCRRRHIRTYFVTCQKILRSAVGTTTYDNFFTDSCTFS